ncbi:MAG: hypothetical protein ACR2PM_08825 [Hyphomicrobiales bacterium]
MSRLTHEEIDQISQQICNYPEQPLPENVRLLISSMLDLVSLAYVDAKQQKAEPPDHEDAAPNPTVALFDSAAARRPKPPSDQDDALEQAAAMVESAIGRWRLAGPFRFSDVIDVTEVKDLLKNVATDIRGLKHGAEAPEAIRGREQAL